MMFTEKQLRGQIELAKKETAIWLVDKINGWLKTYKEVLEESKTKGDIERMERMLSKQTALKKLKHEVEEEFLQKKDAA